MDYSLWAEWYDLFYSTEPPDETDFYTRLAQEAGGAVLEIGVGTGRIAIPAASAGAEVYGVDMSREMLAVAEEKAKQESPLAGSLTLLQADMRSLDLARKDFALVVIPARTLLLATSREEQLATLCSAAAHISPGGRLALNIFNPTPDLLFDDSRESVLIGEVEQPGNGRRLRLEAINNFDTGAQTNDAEQVVAEISRDGAKRQLARLSVRLRYLFPHEVFSMLEETGLAIDEVLGWFDGSPFEEDSEEMIFIARKPEM